jgi:hypothetical protein
MPRAWVPAQKTRRQHSHSRNSGCVASV